VCGSCAAHRCRHGVSRVSRRSSASTAAAGVPGGQPATGGQALRLSADRRAPWNCAPKGGDARQRQGRLLACSSSAASRRQRVQHALEAGFGLGCAGFLHHLRSSLLCRLLRPLYSSVCVLQPQCVLSARYSSPPARVAPLVAAGLRGCGIPKALFQGCCVNHILSAPLIHAWTSKFMLRSITDLRIRWWISARFHITASRYMYLQSWSYAAYTLQELCLQQTDRYQRKHSYHRDLWRALTRMEPS